MYDMIWSCSHVQYDLVLFSHTIGSGCVLVYDINLRATHTTILSIRGVTIPIYLVSSAMDSIRQRVVLFKPVPVPDSDPKSEFLCQSSSSCAEPTDPLNPSYAWDISHALITMYHPYCHSPSALTEYLKQKLCHQRAKCLGRSLSAQVEQNVPLERNTVPAWVQRGLRSPHRGRRTGAAAAGVSLLSPPACAKGRARGVGGGVCLPLLWHGGARILHALPIATPPPLLHVTVGKWSHNRGKGV